MSLELRPAGTDPAAFVDLELLASEPYVTFLYGGIEPARPIHQRLVEASTGELAFGRLASVDGTVAGILVGPLLAPELAQARLRTAMFLQKDPGFGRDATLRARASASRAALFEIAEGDAYLSRIAVSPALRGKRIGERLLRIFLDDSRQKGAKRAVLEVSPRHEAAIAMYRRAGFDSSGEHTATCEDRSLSYLHMSMAL